MKICYDLTSQFATFKPKNCKNYPSWHNAMNSGNTWKKLSSSNSAVVHTCSFSVLESNNFFQAYLILAIFGLQDTFCMFHSQDNTRNTESKFIGKLFTYRMFLQFNVWLGVVQKLRFIYVSLFVSYLINSSCPCRPCRVDP